MKKKKSKPTDSTMRNVKAANRRFEELQHEIEFLKVRYDNLLYHVKILAAGIVERNVTAKNRAKK